MTATACNKWTGLFNVGEEFDDEDLLEADWGCSTESASAPAVTPSEFLKVTAQKSSDVLQSSASTSSGPGESTSGSSCKPSLCAPACSPLKTLKDLTIPGHHSLASSISSLRAPASSLQFSVNQNNPPPPASLSVPQEDLPPQDDFDDWDVDLDELDESIPEMVCQPQKNSDSASDSISPAKRIRPSASCGTASGVSSHSKFCSSSSVSSVAGPLLNTSFTSTIQGPTHLSTPVKIPSHVQGPVTPVSQFPRLVSPVSQYPRPVTPKPPAMMPRGWTGPSTPKTPVQTRGALFHSVSSTPDPSPTITPRPLSTPILTNHLVQLVAAANKTPQRPQSIMKRAKSRRFPGPAGALPQQVSERSLDDIVVSVPQTPTHGAVARLRSEVSSSQGSDEDEFSRGPWAVMKAEIGLDERNPSCFLHSYSVVMVLRKAALRQLAKNKVPNMAVVLKSITHTHADAKAVFRDPTGEMQGTVHRRLVEDKQGELKPGAVLLLKQVGVFSPSHRNHYLNVTPNNLLRIYPPDGVLHSSQVSHPPLELMSRCGPTKPAGGPVSQMELHFDDEGSGPTEDSAWDADGLDELLRELPVESYDGLL